MNNIWLSLYLGTTPIQASSFQEYCSNAMATVKIARGHIVNEISVTERIPLEWSFVDQKLILPDAFVSVVEAKHLDASRETICEGKWGIFYWREVFYKKIRLVRQDGSPFSSNVLGVSKDGTFVEAIVICEELGNSEVMCEESASS